MASPPPCPSLPGMLVSLEAKVELSWKTSNLCFLFADDHGGRVDDDDEGEGVDLVDNADEGGGVEPLKPARNLDFKGLWAVAWT